MILNRKYKMTPEQFYNWLNGYLQITNDKDLLPYQKIIKESMQDLSNLDFAYWLNGYFELTESALSKWDLIVKDHLKLVFNKVTPNYVSPEELVKKMIEDYKEKDKHTKTNPFDFINNPREFPYVATCSNIFDTNNNLTPPRTFC